MAAAGGSAHAAGGQLPDTSFLLLGPPRTVYNSARNVDDRLDSTVRIVLRLQLSAAAAGAANGLLASRGEPPPGRADKAMEEVLAETILADLLYFDGSVPLVYHEDTEGQGDGVVCRHVDPPSVRYVPDPHAAGVVLAFVAPRSLPISSSHCGRPFKLAFLVADREVVFSDSFYMYAKQPKAAAAEVRGGIRPRQGAARKPRYLRSSSDARCRTHALRVMAACQVSRAGGKKRPRRDSSGSLLPALSAELAALRPLSEGGSLSAALASAGLLPEAEDLGAWPEVPLAALNVSDFSPALRSAPGVLTLPPGSDATDGPGFRGAALPRHKQPDGDAEHALFFLRGGMQAPAATVCLRVEGLRDDEAAAVRENYAQLRARVVALLQDLVETP